jgi:hypothetical protein
MNEMTEKEKRKNNLDFTFSRNEELYQGHPHGLGSRLAFSAQRRMIMPSPKET